MCLNLLHLVAVTMARPYAELSNNYMAIYADIMLFLTLFVSMLNKNVAEGQHSQSSRAGFSGELALGMLFATSGGVLALSVVFLRNDLKLASKRYSRLLRYSGGAIVTLRRIENGACHLFLRYVCIFV